MIMCFLKETSRLKLKLFVAEQHAKHVNVNKKHENHVLDCGASCFLDILRVIQTIREIRKRQL